MKDWNSLTVQKQTAEVLRADASVRYFFESDYFMPSVNLFPKQIELLERFYGESKREMVIVGGMRGGKTKTGVFSIIYELFQLLKLENPVEYYDLVPGEQIYITAVSYNENQAIENMESEVVALLEDSPYFSQFNIENVYSQIRVPDKNIRCVFGGSQTPGLLGKTAKAVVFDEIASWRTSSGKFSGEEAYERVSNSVETFGKDGHIFVISSPDNPNDILMRLYRRYQDNENIITEKIPTWEFNPRISREDLEEEFEKNPIAAACDFGCEPMKGTENYMRENAIEKLEEAMDNKRDNILEKLRYGERPDVQPGKYVLAGDPALKHDAFGLALSRRDPSGRFYVEGLYRFSPDDGEIDPTDVAEFIYDVCDKVPVHTFVVDTWQYPSIEKNLEQKGINIEQHIVRKKEYDTFRAELFDENVTLCNYEFVIEEFRDLQVKSKNKIDHTETGSKDVADALVNSMWALEEEDLTDHVPYNRTVSI